MEARRQRLVAVGGTESSFASRLRLHAPVGERVLLVEVAIAGLHATVSYLAPPAVNWGRLKVDQRCVGSPYNGDYLASW